MKYADLILSKILKAFEETNLIAYWEFRLTTESEVFYWDRFTLRSTGEIAGSPRNIRDTGAFIDSQQDPIKTSPTRFEHTWTADYAGTIFEGFDREDGTTAPGRDWFAATFDRWDIRENFERNLKRRMARI